MRRVRGSVVLAIACAAPPEPASDGPPGGDGGGGADTDAADTAIPTPPPRPPNLLVVVLDDVGLDQLPVFGFTDDGPPTPTLDQLAADGVRFDHAFSAPTCSPTRAMLITGRYGRRTGIGRTVIAKEDEVVLPPEEVGIAEVLREAPTPYATAVVGKWHLGSFVGVDALNHPAELGFDRWAVAMGNLGPESSNGTRLDGYDRWERNTDGVLDIVDGYATTVQTDDALRLIDALPEPWLMWLSYNASHSPFHTPPSELTGGATPRGDRGKYQAMTQAVDTELGRLLATLPPDVRAHTVTVVVGDNGAPADTVRDPFRPAQAKDSLYDLGTRVPLIVHGVDGAEAGGVRTGLAHVVDLFPTLAALGGVDPVDPGPVPWPVVLDGQSLLPQVADASAPGRALIYTEQFAPNGIGVARTDDIRAVRDDAWRLMRGASGQEVLFRLGDDDLDDGRDVLTDTPSADALAAQARLAAELDLLEAELGP